MGQFIQEFIAISLVLNLFGPRSFDENDLVQLTSDISNQVSTTLNKLATLKSDLLKVRQEVEHILRTQFKAKSSQFDSFIRKFTAQLQQYSTPRGDREQAGEIHGNLITIGDSSVELGQKKLQAVF